MTTEGLQARARAAARAGAAMLVLGCSRPPMPPVGHSLEEGAPSPANAELMAAPRQAAPAAPPQSAPHAASPLSCDLPDSAVEAPLFASNDANLRERGTQILDDVVACMNAALFGGHSLLIVGYSDPRGPASYNHAIALERARAARRYLIRRGVPPARIQIASRGEREALGEAPETWLYDRRVEIRLLPKPVGAPDDAPVRMPERVPEPEPVPEPDSVPQPER